MFFWSHRDFSLPTRRKKKSQCQHIKCQVSKFEKSEQAILKICCNEACRYVELCSSILPTKSSKFTIERHLLQESMASFSLMKHFHVAVSVLETSSNFFWVGGSGSTLTLVRLRSFTASKAMNSVVLATDLL